MKPEELYLYERMYRAIEELMGTKLLRFSFPVEKGSDDLADHEAKSDTVRSECRRGVRSPVRGS